MGVLGYLIGVVGYLISVLGYLMGVLKYLMAWRRRQTMAPLWGPVRPAPLLRPERLIRPLDTRERLLKTIG